MTGTAIVGIALLFLVLLLAWVFWPPSAESEDSKRGAGTQLPSFQMLERIWSREDLEYVRAQSPELKDCFLRERKAFALVWLRDLHRATSDAVRIYRSAVSVDASLRLSVEVRIVVEYATFLILLRAAQLLIYVARPDTARSITVRILSAAESLSAGAMQIVGKSPLVSEE